jgi:uncharacterized protein (DUF3084 family)
MTRDAGQASAALQAALDRHTGWQLEYDIALIAADRKRLLDEINQLTDRIERADQTIANSAEIITARDKRIRELEAERDEARGIARVLTPHATASTAALCRLKLGLAALPGWLTDDPQPGPGPTRQGYGTTTSEGN